MSPVSWNDNTSIDFWRAHLTLQSTSFHESEVGSNDSTSVALRMSHLTVLHSGMWPKSAWTSRICDPYALSSSTATLAQFHSPKQWVNRWIGSEFNAASSWPLQSFLCSSLIGRLAKWSDSIDAPSCGKSTEVCSAYQCLVLFSPDDQSIIQ